MPSIKIDTDKCKGCLLCINFCPKGFIVVEKALNRKGVRPAKFNGDPGCLGCKMCAVICPDCCIEVYTNE